MTWRPGLLAVAVPSLLLHLLMRGSRSVSDPHVLGLILDGPHLLHALMRKMKEVQAGRIPSPPPPPPSTTLFTLLLVPFVQPCLAHTGPPALTHPRLFCWGGGGRSTVINWELEASFHFLHFSGIIPSDLMCKFLSILFLFLCSTVGMFKS